MIETIKIILYRLEGKIDKLLKLEQPPKGKWVMLNCVNWMPLNNLPISDTSECTYFVLPVSANGVLVGTNSTLEAKFVSDVHSGGKKATFSVAGGTQKIDDITLAVKQKTNLVNAIGEHIKLHKYDGVWIDIENTKIDPQVMVDFILAVRTKLDSIAPNLILGVYTQHWQKDTVWAKIQDASSAISFMSVMVYDFQYTIDELKKITLDWFPKIKDRSKLLAGVAVNYQTGLTVLQYGEVLDFVNSEKLGGVGIWENTLFTEEWRKIQRLKFIPT